MNRTRRKLILSRYLDEGDLVKVFWKDTTVIDRVAASKINEDMMSIDDTISVGILMDWDKDNIMIAQEYCFDLHAEASSIEILPLGMITKIEIMRINKVLTVRKNFILESRNPSKRRIKRKYKKWRK